METLAEGHYEPWRERLWMMVKGFNVLEAGVGMGKTMAHYPETGHAARILSGLRDARKSDRVESGA
jgi:hypothetical protein